MLARGLRGGVRSGSAFVERWGSASDYRSCCFYRRANHISEQRSCERPLDVRVSTDRALITAVCIDSACDEGAVEFCWKTHSVHMPISHVLTEEEDLASAEPVQGFPLWVRAEDGGEAVKVVGAKGRHPSRVDATGDAMKKDRDTVEHGDAPDDRRVQELRRPPST